MVLLASTEGGEPPCLTELSLDVTPINYYVILSIVELKKDQMEHFDPIFDWKVFRV